MQRNVAIDCSGSVAIHGPRSLTPGNDWKTGPISIKWMAPTPGKERSMLATAFVNGFGWTEKHQLTVHGWLRSLSQLTPPPPRKVAAPLQYMHQAKGSDPEMNSQHTCHSFCVAIQFGVLARRCPCFDLWCRLGCLGRHHDDVGWPLVPI